MTNPDSVGQTSFTSALLNPDIDVPLGLIDPKGRPAGKRFDVYRNNVVSSLLDAMQTAFPIIYKLVGDKFFNAMSGVYIRQYPPQSPMLMFYGIDFPAFLEAFEPVAHLPYLADVARLELIRRQSYHGGDAPPIDPQSLINMDPEKLMQARFELAPSAYILASDHPIQSIWHFNMVDDTQGIASKPEHVLVTRPAMDVDAVTISQATYIFLQNIMNDATLDQSNDRAVNTESSFDLSGAIGIMIATQIIKTIKT